MAGPPKKHWQPVFLNLLGKNGNVSLSAHESGIARQTAYDARDRDKAFSQAWEDAMEQASDVLEREAWRRAAEGVKQPVFYRGEVVGHVRKYSDVLLMFLLNGARPDKYRERLATPSAGKTEEADAALEGFLQS